MIILGQGFMVRFGIAGRALPLPPCGEGLGDRGFEPLS